MDDKGSTVLFIKKRYTPAATLIVRSVLQVDVVEQEARGERLALTTLLGS